MTPPSNRLPSLQPASPVYAPVNADQHQPAPRADESPHQAPAPRAIRSDELFAGQREILILHGTETYRLRITRAGKLILHK